jgi:hypothetical protein
MLYILCVVSALAALSLDWLQTLTIAGHPQTFSEVNPILGRHPAKWQVTLYFIGCMLLTILVAVALYVTGHTIIGICLALGLALFEAVVVVRNKVLGVSLMR